MSKTELSLDEAIQSERLDDFIAQAEAAGVAAADAELERPAKKKKHWHNPKQFYIVFSPDGETPPKVVHPTHKGALVAAVRMARFHPDKSFFVMGSMSARVVPREEAPQPEQPAA